MKVEINNLSKKYQGNDFYSLRDVNLTMDDGDIVGLIGKNGSGKSTLLKMLGKFLHPTEGRIYFDGEDIQTSSNMLSNCGLLIETVFYSHLSVEENLKFIIDLHHYEEYEKNVRPLLELVDLWDRRKDRADSFSYGMKQRLALVIALLHEPEFIILDEPFVGLDPIGVSKLINTLKEAANKEQTTMIISSHQLNELEAICNRYVFIENGQLVEKTNNEDLVQIKLVDVQQVETLLSDSLRDQVKVDQEGMALVIKEAASREELNQILETLAHHQLIESIEIGEHLERYFKEDTP
ncbi:ABC transporter ATP-binding protein [Aerococcus sp. UMB1112A]|uniref:ABC transporter ATP-binding protein n=1 Tax=Aerococcus sp. UMB1112A TaxID=3050609 RepID=UPI00254C74DD|nr:ABC transporter ATP-binding protein [Aerococcus sp. UMB1112A]MDK8502630.1 ABC transporter ATP-binding protein [Aerococcus sp. UMB1112A]